MFDVIQIQPVGNRFEVKVSPPESRESWTSARPLSATEVLHELGALGCHSTDVTDALHATGKVWWEDHERVVLDKRADEAWLLDKGFRVVVRREDTDLYWADLVSDATGVLLAPGYGRGVNGADAVKQARARLEIEQRGEQPFS